MAQTTGDYRSLLTGTWTTATNWQMYNGTAWVTAAAAPNNTNGVITIQSGHTMTIGATVVIDQVVIDAGGNITWTNGNCTIDAGPGVDLTINGTFTDSRAAGGASITFNTGATWQMGAAGTLIRTVGNSSNNWQSSYEGGISNIPATANWIIRKNSAQNPALSTTTPATGAVYPNLIIENTTATAWTMPAGSSFTGTSIFPTIKGNLDIGGTGTSTVDFLNNCTYTPNATLVQGNVIVRTGNTIRNYGTGLEVRGNLTINGTISYDASDGRKLIFSGANAQTISGTGTLGIYDLTINKSANALTLNRAITIDNLCTFTSGIMYTTAVNLPTLNTNASVTGASNASFVSGPIRYIGTSALTFPVGKGADYQPIGISASASTSVTFWNETFDGTACTATSGCDPSLVGWTETALTGNGASANKFYVSCQENGNAAGTCGSGCGADQSLHVGNVATSAAAGLFCPTGDCGAAFDDTGAGERTNKRAESPTINCTGMQNITVAFNYIEQGGSTDDVGDDASLWYFDGTTWALLSNMPSTVNSGCLGQGRWTAYSAVLPASADGNPNVKIGFVWVNDGDGAASDPSFGVDDISLTSNPLIDFTAEYFYSNPQIPYGNTLAPPLTTLSACEYWILNRNAGTENKFVTLAWDINSCAVTSLSSLRVARYDGISTWQNEGNTATTGSTGAGTITSNLVTNFSPFTLADITVLPIELLEFTANYDGTNVNCLWITATELNNDFFTVERSADGENFMEIGRLKGAGTTNVQQNYFLPDDRPMVGTSYYRLRQTDYNGMYTYSPVRPIYIGQGSNLHLDVVSQNNAQLQLNYTLPENTSATISIHDMTGRLVYTAPVSGNMVTIPNKSNWSKGIYTVVLTNGKMSDHRKFVLE